MPFELFMSHIWYLQDMDTFKKVMLTNMTKQSANKIYAFSHGSRPVGKIRQLMYIYLLEKKEFRKTPNVSFFRFLLQVGFSICIIFMHVLLWLTATLADFVDLSNPFGAALNGGAATSVEPLKPPLQYIGKFYKGSTI